MLCKDTQTAETFNKHSENSFAHGCGLYEAVLGAACINDRCDQCIYNV